MDYFYLKFEAAKITCIGVDKDVHRELGFAQFPSDIRQIELTVTIPPSGSGDVSWKFDHVLVAADRDLLQELSEEARPRHRSDNRHSSLWSQLISLLRPHH